ncbi:Hsp70 family protein, partial [Glycomyces tenuis]|uniref:Hsp70 family protein n=1 Tax=Glycomyces tenuis TaxID=58116 RepID=UPI00138E2EAE
PPSYFVETLGSDVPVGSGVVVYDLGGGTFDATVLRRSGTGFDVLAVDGADDLGGLDFDQALAEHVAASVQPEDERWQRLTAPIERADLRHRTAFLEEVRQAKERLSRSTSTDLTIPLLDIDAHLTRDELESVAAPLIERTVRITQGVIRESGLPKDQLAGLFLVGAASRMPLVATMLHRELGLAPAAIEQPELAVSEGGLVAQALASSPPPVPSPALPPQVTSQPAGPTVPMAAPGMPTPGGPMPPGSPMPTPGAPMPPHMTGPIQTPASMPGAPLPPAQSGGGVGAWLKSKTGMITVGAAGLAVVLVLALILVPGLIGDSEDGTGSNEGDTAAEQPDEEAAETEDADSGSGESDSSQAGTGEESGTAELDSAVVGDPVLLEEGAHVGTVRAVETAVVGGEAVGITAGDDNIIRVWGLSSGELLGEYRGHKEPVVDLVVTADGDRPVVLSTDTYEEHVWYLDDYTTVSQPREANTGDFFWVGEVDGTPAYADDYSIYQAFTGAEIDTTSTSYASFWTLAEIDGTLRGVGVEENRVFVSDLETGEYIGATFDQQSSEVVAARFGVVDDVPVMFTADAAGTIQGWDLTSGEKYGPALSEQYQTVEEIELVDVGDGVQVLVRGTQGLSLFDFETGEPVTGMFAQYTDADALMAVEVADVDGHPVAVTGSGEGTVAAWSLNTNPCLLYTSLS